MKTIHKALFLWVGLLLWLPALQASPVAGPAFSVSPAVVSNTYSGYLTLLITGLTNTETVVVQKYLDANGNGVADPGEPLWQQFTLTDGASVQIGGVTNLNVPGDLDTVPGPITARINFQADSAQRFSAGYVYVLSSPSGHFPAISIPFAVTNSLYPQSFTGTVLGNGVVAPYSGVILFQLSSNQNLTAVGGTVANAAGTYTLPAPPGQYALAAFQHNFVANIAAAAFLNLVPGTTINTNLNMTSTTETISGTIQLAGNPGQGLPGLLTPVQTKAGLIAVGISDTNGNFSVGVSPNQWSVDVNSPGIALLGCVGLQSKSKVDTTTNSVSGVPINLPHATSFFYGTVKDAFGNPLPGAVDVEAYDNSLQQYQADGVTDSNGNFAVNAIGGLGAFDLWWVDISSDTALPNYVFSQPAFDQFGGTNLGIGQAVPVNIIGIVATNQISGHVQTSSGQPISGVGVSANATISCSQFNTYADTDASGNFSFTVGNGLWNVSLNTQYGSDSLSTILGAGTYQSPPSDLVGITNQSGVANFTVEPCDGSQIFTTNLPSAQTNVFYTYFLNGTTCSGQQIWTEFDPADFPPNFSLTSYGQIQGTAINTGSYTFTVQLSDGNGSITNRTLTLVINGSSGNLAINSTTLTNATQNAFYSNRLSAVGGVPPYTWTLSPGSAGLPSGISLSTNGVISGTPIGSGTATFIPAVTDSTGAFVYEVLSLTVNSSSLPQAIKLALSPSAAPGTIQFSFKIAAGVTYTIQTSTDLKTWTNYQTFDFTNNNSTAGETWTVTLPNPGGTTQSFYRVKVGP